MLKLTITVLMLCCFFTQVDTRQSKRGNKPPIIEAIDATPNALTFCWKAAAELICDKSNRKTVTVSVVATDPEGGFLKYSYTPSVGEILGEGNRVTWNLAEQPFGTHETRVTVSDSDGAEATGTIKVEIGVCRSCVIQGPPCPNISVKSWREEAHRAEKLAFSVDVSTSAYFQSRPDYLWIVKGGEIVRGQNTPHIIVKVTGDISTNLTAIVDVKGIAPECNGGASASVRITP